MRYVTGPAEMRSERRKLLISFSFDMADWARSIANHILTAGPRLRDQDFDLVFWHRLDPGAVNAAEAWAEHIVETSDPCVDMVIVLLGERIGVPTPGPDGFSGGRRIAAALQTRGVDWIKVAGVDADFALTAEQPGSYVPLTGTLYEYLDAVLHQHPAAGGANRPHVVVAIHGDLATRNFGFGRLRSQIAALPMRERIQKQAAHDLQGAWLDCFYARFLEPRQAPEIWFAGAEDLFPRIDAALDAVFGREPLDPFSIELPNLAPYPNPNERIGGVRRREGELYFGFKEDLARLLTRVEAATPGPSVTVLAGSSGSGKSSLLRAGLAARLQEPHMADLGWLVVVRTPDDLQRGAAPLVNLALAIAAALAPRHDIGPTEELVALVAAAGTLQPLLARLDRTLPPTAPLRLVLVIDQAETLVEGLREEAATPPAPSPVWAPLFDQLLDLAALLPPGDAPKTPVRLIDVPALKGRLSIRLLFGVTSRSQDGLLLRLDRLGKPELVHLMPSPSEASLRDIIERTFGEMGLTLEGALRDQIAEEAIRLRGSAVRPLLSVSLTALHGAWRDAATRLRLQSRPRDAWPVLTQEEFGSVARLARAIDLLGERAWQSVYPPPPRLPGRRRPPVDPQAGQRDIRFARLMRALVGVSYGDGAAAGTSVVLRELAVDDPRLVAMQDLVRALGRERLMADGESGRLRLMHEAVLEHWGRAAQWRAAEQRHLTTRRRLTEAVEDWVRERRAATALLTSLHLLDEAAAILFAWGDDLDATVAGSEVGHFVRASLAAAYPFPGAQAPGAQARPSLVNFVPSLCAFGEVELLRTVLATDRGVLSALFGPLGVPALVFGAEAGQDQIVAALLDAGAEPNLATTDDGRTALIQAAQQGHDAVVAALLAAGADPNLATTDDGHTALILAAQQGHYAVVAALLAAGAEPNLATTDEGTTALILAAQNGHDAVVAALLAAGAEPNHAQTNDGRTALIQAAQQGHNAVVAALLAAGAEPNLASTDDGRTALIQAAQNGYDTVVAALLAAGADPNVASTDDGRTALIMAAHYGHAAVLAALLAAGAEPNHAQTNDGRTALIQAAQQGHAAVVAALLAAGAEPNHAQTNDGRTALIQASQNGHAAVAAALLAAGAEPNLATTDEGTTALILAAQNGHDAVVAALLAAGADPNHARTNDGRTALIQAAQEGRGAVVAALLAAGAEPNQATTDVGRTALIQAAHNGHDAVVAALLAAGADPNLATTDVGRTALIQAAQNGHAGVVAALLGAGADPALASAAGRAIDVALAADRATIASRLLAAGAVCTRLAGRGFRASQLPLRFARLPWQETADDSDPATLREALALPPGARLESLVLPAVADGRLLRVTIAAQGPDEDVLHFIFVAPLALAVADGTNAPLYAFAAACGLDLAHPRIGDWAIVFLSLVSSRHGRFVIVETEDDVPWLPAATTADRQDLAAHLHPLQSQPDEGDGCRLRACMVFLDALFEADIVIRSDGRTELENEKQVREDLPIEGPVPAPMTDSQPMEPDPTEMPAGSLAGRIRAALPADPAEWVDMPLLPVTAQDLPPDELAAVIARHAEALIALYQSLELGSFVVPERGRKATLGNDGKARLVEYQVALPTGRTVVSLWDTDEAAAVLPVEEGAFAAIAPTLLAGGRLEPQVIAALFLALEPMEGVPSLPMQDEANVPWAAGAGSQHRIRAMLAIRPASLVSVARDGITVRLCWIEGTTLYRGEVLVTDDRAATEVVGEPEVLLRDLPVRRRVMLTPYLRTAVAP